jgi:hypothetical protein
METCVPLCFLLQHDHMGLVQAGFSDAQLRLLLLKFPRIVEYSTELIKEHADFLRSLGIRDEQLAKVRVAAAPHACRSTAASAAVLDL